MLQDPRRAEALCRELARAFREDGVQVVAPALGGILVAHEVARALGCRALFAEREDGVMTTGGSTRQVIRVVQDAGGVVVGVGALIDRGGGSAAFPMKKAVLATLTVPTYPPDVCPLCK